MAKKFYVVWAGRETGVFDNWAHTKSLVDKFPQARYKSFPNQAEAQAAFTSGKPASTTAKSHAGKSSAKPNVKSTGSKATGALDPDFDVHIFCDGGCDPNPGKAGSGVAVYREGTLSELWYGLYNPMGTNNTAELNALHQALLIAEQTIKNGKRPQIKCDSKYSIDCVTNWAFGWKTKGWKRKVAGDIKNLEIIQQAHALFVTLQDDVEVSHVKAHIGIEGNELADRMTMVAVSECEAEFAQYRDLNVAAILALRAG
mgnify:CR=1 FL=1